jgi:hypothetical protein
MKRKFFSIYIFLNSEIFFIICLNRGHKNNINTSYNLLLFPLKSVYLFILSYPLGCIMHAMTTTSLSIAVKGDRWMLAMHANYPAIRYTYMFFPQKKKRVHVLYRSICHTNTRYILFISIFLSRHLEIN